MIEVKILEMNMKKVCTFLLIVIIGFNAFGKDLSKNFKDLSNESDKLVLMSAHLYEVARSYDEYSKDALILKSAANIAGRYAMEILNISILYGLNFKMQTPEDVDSVMSLVNIELSSLYIRLSTEKNPLLGVPQFLDPLVLDDYLARKELSLALDEFEKLGNRIYNLSSLIE